MADNLSVEILELPQSDPRIQTLIATHQQYCAAHTPQGSGHAIKPDKPDAKPDDPHTRFILAERNGQSVGCIGLRQLSKTTGEIKTMHVLQAERGAGIADQLLAQAISRARTNGIETLFLETGRSEGFAASRHFYARSGFAPCDSYGEYATDSFSYCMKMAL